MIGTFLNASRPVARQVGAAGGGGGGIDTGFAAGGGGGGEVLPDIAATNFILNVGTYAFSIGAGAAQNVQGNDSTFNGRTLKGGGKGGPGGSGGGQNGGSGGGGGAPGGTGGTSTATPPGIGTVGGTQRGGGAVNAGNAGSQAGLGYVSTINGSTVEYSQGGNPSSPVNPAGPGSGGANNSSGLAGIWIIRYPGPARGPASAGNAITTVGNDTVHTLTGSGNMVITS